MRIMSFVIKEEQKGLGTVEREFTTVPSTINGQYDTMGDLMDAVHEWAPTFTERSLNPFAGKQITVEIKAQA